jgi:hypothetical protein
MRPDVRSTGPVSIHDMSDDEEPLAGIEGIGLRVTKDHQESTEITILQAEGLVLDLDRIEDPYDSLDADSQELEGYGCLFDLDRGGLNSDLEEKLEVSSSSHVVIAERVRLAPAWRGLGGVGRYLVSRVLPWVSAHPAVVATQPFPLDVPRDAEGNVDDATFKPALKAIQRTWRSIGFEPYKGDIWIMDPNARKHERAVARLERKLNITPAWATRRK